MPKNLRFWLNVILISAAHVVVIAGLVRWSREPKTPNGQGIVWMNGSAGDGAAIKSTPLPKPAKVSIPEPKSESKDEPEDDRPVLTAAKSEIQLPAATPTPSPRSTSTPRPSPSPLPKVKVPPKATPKPKPKPTATPKPSPKKLVIAKASPKPKPAATPEETKEKDDVDLAEKKPAEEKPAATPAESSPPPVTARPGTGKGTSSGNGGRIGGSGGQSQFGWYGSMLHDRLYSEWVQPSSIASTAKMSALVKIRIEKDGRVSRFEIVRPSGNAAVDESVSAVAKRVTQVEALPPGLGNGEHYDVKINFELNSE
jgi:TonB family protein